ncbi:MAG: hypothetical protein HY000_18490 [Planctomycetes bacterium]|nr:hypothetical protein [Planctomycetota bacterium]
MSAILISFVMLIPVTAILAGQSSSSSELEREIAGVDQIASDGDAKLPLLHAMALDLGTHRNHLILLRKQSSRTFAEIYVNELRVRGLTDEAIVRKLRLLEGRTAALRGPETSREGAIRPIAYLGTSTDHSSAGTFVTMSPEIGLDARRFAVAFGVPIYRISSTLRHATGIGDAYASIFLRQPARAYDLGAALTLSAPTGDRDQGLGAGRVSVDLNGTVARRFERVRPFVTGGFTNSVLNNVGYQRPFISNGNALYASGGVDYRLHRRLTAGVGGFTLQAFGTHTVISTMMTSSEAESPWHVSARMGGDMPGVQMGSAAAPLISDVSGKDIRDRGVSAWASWSIHRDVTVGLKVARSIPYELTTVRFGLGFNFSGPLSGLLRK